MNSKVEQEAERLAAAVAEINEEIDLAAEEDASPDDVERAKGLAANLLAKYDDLLKRLGAEEKMEVQRTIGLKIERMKGKLTQLLTAPE